MALSRDDINDISEIIAAKTNGPLATLTSEMKGVHDAITEIKGTNERIFELMGQFPNAKYCEEVQRRVTAELNGVRGIAEEAMDDGTAIRKDVVDLTADINKGKGAMAFFMFILGFLGLTGLFGLVNSICHFFSLTPLPK